MNRKEQLEPLDFLSEDGHFYSILKLENYLKTNEDENNKIISFCKDTTKKIKSAPKFVSLATLLKNYNSIFQYSHKINKRIKRLRLWLKPLMEQNEQLTKELDAAKIKIQELEKQKDNPAQAAIIYTQIRYNKQLVQQIQNLEQELRILKANKPIVVEKNARTKKKLKWLNNASIELENAKKEVANTLTARARKAGKAKKSPYEKAGTKEKVKEYWLMARKEFTNRGAKQNFINDMLEKAVTNILPMPNNSNFSEKTIRNWIKEFEHEIGKSSS
ncbi:hypothetical protein [Snodgrassella alvi]|jgi:DNA repair exonuclease SbcCD ATPase subunit|uniref:hypothetical protein n=1 Tax=Snodgrassella alvi TaxID=1196083 RepID=UPI000C1E279B|nr:hypothetical protein [Snodgrassella alvi]PIT46995.1 hypothetical protein BHC51_06720 [Snodgrassella alvi]